MKRNKHISTKQPGRIQFQTASGSVFGGILANVNVTIPPMPGGMVP